ncbi:MAG TPA: hypothetical protein VLE43_18920 [Candidatus Saccharimonadia bacterium]|nr:hypothetical protein [Candidatus Saccharimonadia bacterium]
MTIRTLILSTFLAINSGFAEDLPLPLPLPAATPGLPVIRSGPTSLEKPNLVIRPPGAGVIVVPQITEREKQEQAVAEKERQLIDEMLRRQIALAHATGKAGEIKRVILVSGPGDAALSQASAAPTATAGRLELIGIEPNAGVTKQLDSFFGSRMTPESEQRLLQTVKTQLTAEKGKDNLSVRLAGWWPEEGVVAVSVVPESIPGKE